MMTQKKTRKAIAFLVLFAVIASISAPFALAAGPGAQPDYVGLLVGTCGFVIGPLGLSNAAGTAELKVGYTATARLKIMKSSDLITWTPYKQWTSEESNSISMDQYWALVRGYFYKATMAITVHDSDENVVEYVEIDSDILYY